MTESTEISYKQLPSIFYKPLAARKWKDTPSIALWNEELAEQMALQSFERASVLVGDVEGGIAQSYAGHQFGQFTMLGDGRAMLIAEREIDGRRFDVQLKGSGLTPFSRGGDGLAALGPMLREYIISEGMHALGVPTTRSLAVTVTGEPIHRQHVEVGAVLTRVAASHIRVGTFQYARFVANDLEALKQLADYTMARHYPTVEKENYGAFFEEVVKKQATLIAKWQLLGFVHGVMNTDNVTISGETIDYGPCAFLDVYNPNTVFSSIDQNGRYRFKNQPAIAGWNLTRFAECLIPLIHEEEEQAIDRLESILKKYERFYYTAWSNGMAQKIGFSESDEDVDQLVQRLLQTMAEQQLDYTNTFRQLTNGQHIDQLATWEKEWLEQLEKSGQSIEAARQLMRQVNPVIIPRNYYVEQAIQEAEMGDFTLAELLIAALKKPYEQTALTERYMNPPIDNKPYVTYCGT